MRTITIDSFFQTNQVFADAFIAKEYRETKKTLPHTLTLTFNSGDYNSNRKMVDYIIDLLYQAMVMKQPIEKLFVDIDKRNKAFLVINIW